MGSQRRHLALLAALAATGCPHDFTLPVQREAGADVVAPRDRNRDQQPDVVVTDRGHQPDRGCPSPCVTTLAGRANAAFADGPLAQAYFDRPSSIVVRSPGELLVADTGNNRVRRIAGGQATTLAGQVGWGWVDGPVETARLAAPRGLAMDGTSIYVTQPHGVRRIADGQVTTVAGSASPGMVDGPAADARFDQPWGLAWNSTVGLLVADYVNYRIRRVSGGQVSTYAGGAGELSSVSYMAVDGAGVVYLSDGSGISRITNGQVETFAGLSSQSGLVNGPLAQARFFGPAGMAFDAAGALLVADSGNYVIRRIANGTVSTFAGSGESGLVDGPADQARFSSPAGIAVEGSVLYVADQANNCIRRIE